MNRRFLLLLLILSCHSTLADGIHFGAAYRCDEKLGSFELAAYVEHNEFTTVYSGGLPGLKPLEDGEHKLSCRVGGRVTHAVVRVYPASNGECRGAGYVKLSPVTFDGKALPLFASEEPFNWSCHYGPMLIKLSIHSSYDGQVFVVNRCKASAWTWEHGYKEVECQQERIEHWLKP
ncbi:MAG TPA: hypothetical protein VK629_13100 [Steroidobacteraceae bacterium]|nr:hypothetical protein [Steroidobacteraceae bacterium]